ncbi:MAG: DUF2236 domain-containing protein [Acidobacteriota bacterium]|nr:DUF2236 domain-containing protein [Acidobacteriota bacterium]MDE3222487.1 DUF2236 domain-containing protein [Acidobacteriota bacterium]
MTHGARRVAGSAFADRLKTRANLSIRAAVGISDEPPPICSDPALAYTPVDGVSRLIHGDLASMLIGGLASLFFQMLHPLAMAGVAQHSRYQRDPLGRMFQTAHFIGATTYGTKESAYAAIERVRAVHEAVRGTADDGRAYDANDPHLLAWVHCAEISMFLAGYERFGRETLRVGEADAYVQETAQLARDLGVASPPTTVAELRACLNDFRPELRLSPEGALARDFIARGVVKGFAHRLAYWLIVRSSYALMEPWARELLGVRVPPRLERWIWRPLARLTCRALRVAVPPVPRFRSN